MTLVGTLWYCRCGREYKRPVVSVDRVNDLLRDYLKRSLVPAGEASQQPIPLVPPDPELLGKVGVVGAHDVPA